MQAQALDVQVHLVDGTMTTFLVKDTETLTKILGGTEPPKLFGQPYLAFAGAAGIAVFPSDQVARVDLVTKDQPPWKMRAGAEGQLREITVEEFNRKYEPHKKLALTRRKHRETGDEFEGFAYIRLRDGSKTIVEIQAKMPARLQQKVILDPLLKGPTIFFPRVGGGVCFLNTRNIVRLDLLPGMPEIAPGAWLAEPKPSGTKTARRGGEG